MMKKMNVYVYVKNPDTGEYWLQTQSEAFRPRPARQTQPARICLDWPDFKVVSDE